MSFIMMRYRRYAKVYELMKNRHNVYNDTLDFLAEQVVKGTVFLIHPKVNSDVCRIEKNRYKLKAFYEEGYWDGHDCYDDLLAFLKK